MLVALFSASCRSSERASELPARTAGSAEAVELPPSFRREILPVLERHCSSADGCHGARPTDSVDLDLRASAAHSQLVNHPAKIREGAVLVRPGDVAASFLVDKLTGALAEREGKAMPLDADTGTPIEPSPLPPDFIERVLGPWILAGAPVN